MRIVNSRLLQQIWLPVILVGLIWVLSDGSTSIYFPPLREVVQNVWSELTGGQMVSDLEFSLRNLAVGFVLGSVVAIAGGLLIGVSKELDIATRPLLTFFRATPQLAFVPVVILALGIGPAPKIFTIALGTFWPVLLNTVQGVRGISPSVLETARAYRIPARLRMRRVVLPGAAPQIFAGLRLGMSIAVIVTVVSEMYGSSTGIGFYVLQSGQRFAILDTWSGTLVIGAIGYLLSLAMLGLETASLGWYHRRPAHPGRRRTRPTTTEATLVTTGEA